MAILKLKPYIKDYIWGGQKLIKNYNINSNKRVAEAWLVSCHPDGPSLIEVGKYKGFSLKKYIDMKGNKILGKHGEKHKDFPILIKLIDAHQNLSVQVHPNDSFALKHEGELGKNEMWLVLDASPEAYIYYGVAKTITKEKLKKSIEENTILSNLNKITTHKNDVFYIPAGTIHAIGAGNIILEVQQNSNSTYRLYDYNRKDSTGQYRELHVEKALKVSNLEPIYNNKELIFEENIANLIDNDFFKCRIIKVDGSLQLKSSDLSFQALIVISGQGRILGVCGELVLRKGNAVFVEANTTYIIQGNFEILITEI